MKKGLGAGIGFVGVLWIVIRLIRAGMTYSDIENREIARENAEYKKELMKLEPELVEMKILDSTIADFPVFYCRFTVDDSLTKDFKRIRLSSIIRDIQDEEIVFQLPEPPFLGMSEFEIHGSSFSKEYFFKKIKEKRAINYSIMEDSITRRLNKQYQ